MILIQAVGQGRCGRLVDDTLHVQTGDTAGVLGGLTLSVGEVCGDGDDRLGDGGAQVSLGVSLQLLQDHGRDFLGGVSLVVNGDLVVGAHLTLDGGDGAVRVGDGLALCHLAHHTLAGLGECHHRGSGAGAFGVGDNDGFAAFHNGNTAVGGAKIYTYNFTHCNFLLYE